MPEIQPNEEKQDKQSLFAIESTKLLANWFDRISTLFIGATVVTPLTQGTGLLPAVDDKVAQTGGIFFLLALVLHGVAQLTISRLE